MLIKISLEPTSTLAQRRPPPFPSRTLITTNIASCFLCTAALILSLAQITTKHALIAIPNAIGFTFTISYHTYLYVCASRYLETKRRVPHSIDIEAIFTPHRIIAAFLLVTGWVVILLVNILLSLKAAPGAIATTVIGGLELFTLFFLAIRSSQENWAAGNVDPKDPIHNEFIGYVAQFGLRREIAHLPFSHRPLLIPSQLLYLVSFVIASVCLVVSIGLPSFFFNLFAFVATVPYHLTIFIESGRPQPLTKTSLPPSPLKDVALSFLLVGAWGFAFVLDVANDTILFQRIVSGIFGGIQCVIVGYLALQGVLKNLDCESQVKLP
ncbi:hypothetical protein H0H87_010258 [Tephrocybe sp. NHM501043]|nr:hypothetical protein H0H87_010258 [Tephrocybe sp. NHM501043]